jgi:mannosyl-3-phosphoglycerate phosphatase
MLVLVTDLDGTLLDHESYSWAAALPALKRTEELGVPVVLCTSKCFAEVEPLRREMGLSAPVIVENGGALIVPERAIAGVPEMRVELGAPYTDLVKALAAASVETGVQVRGFSQMAEEELALIAGLPREAAALALKREYDEPFVIAGEDRALELLRAIERRGFGWTRGGRFYHIIGGSDKAAAVRRLRDLYRAPGTVVEFVGLGDGWNDVGFLRACDRAFVIASPSAGEIAGQIPGAAVTRLPGPAGWNEAVLSLLAQPDPE